MVDMLGVALTRHLTRWLGRLDAAVITQAGLQRLACDLGALFTSPSRIDALSENMLGSPVASDLTRRLRRFDAALVPQASP